MRAVRPSCGRSVPAGPPKRSACVAPRRNYGGSAAGHDAHGHAAAHGSAHKKPNHPQLLDEDPEWINDPRDAYYVRSISAEHRAVNKDLDAAYRGMSVYIKAEHIAPPGVYDPIRKADELRKAKVDAEKAAAKKAYAEELKAQEGKGWRKYLNRSSS